MRRGEERRGEVRGEERRGQERGGDKGETGQAAQERCERGERGEESRPVDEEHGAALTSKRMAVRIRRDQPFSREHQGSQGTAAVAGRGGALQRCPHISKGGHRRNRYVYSRAGAVGMMRSLLSSTTVHSMSSTFEQHKRNSEREHTSKHRHKSFIIDPLYYLPPNLIPAHHGVLCGVLLRQSALDGQGKVVQIAHCCGLVTRRRGPRTAVRPRPPQHIQVPALNSVLARRFWPRAVVRPRPLQHLQVPVPSGM